VKTTAISLIRWVLGLAVFAVAALTVLIAAFLLPTRHLNRVIRWGCRAVLWATGVRVQVEHETPLTGGPFLFVGNHVNIFDPFVYGGYLPRPVRGVELESHFRWPLYGAVIRRIGNVPIRQRPGRSVLESYDKAGRLIRQGISVVILPEGHRTLTGRLGSFTRAPFRFAKDLGLDVVPVALVGAYRIKRKSSWHIRPDKVVLKIGRPVRAEEIKQLSDSELRHLLRQRVEALLEDGQDSRGSADKNA